MRSPATDRLVLLLAALLAACVNATSGLPDGGARAIRSAAASIGPDQIYDRIAFLASDELRGRDTPSPGLERAARWIADEFAAFGLEPAGDDGGWFQRYPFPLEALSVDDVRFEIIGGATHALEYGVEFFARAGIVPGRTVGAVYVGDEIPGAGAELRDRAVVLRLPGTPTQARGGLRFPMETRGGIAGAIARAAEAGAAALVFVMEPGVTRQQVEGLAEAAAAPGRVLGGHAATAGPAAFFITRDAARRLFRAGGLDAAEVLARPAVARPMPLSGVTLRLGARHRVLADDRPPNVVGVLRGSDPVLRDTYVVLSAHMDHLGVGRPVNGDSIYNGADDNASGTAAIIEVARALASLPAAPRRSVVFLAVSGEEKGLLGSRWFSEHPTVPLEAIVANVNVDMIGRNAPDSIVVIGKEYSSLGPLVRDVATRNPQLGLTVSRDLWPEQRFFFRSDHYSFARKEIPALFFFAGIHEHYHRPGDEVDRIDTDKTARVARLVLFLTHELAQSEHAPEWTAAGLEHVRRLNR